MSLSLSEQNVHMKLELALDEDSIFYKLGSSGLITFSDYIFLLTVLSSKSLISIPSACMFITLNNSCKILFFCAEYLNRL